MVHPTMLCLFLTFGIWGLCKIFTNLFQIRQVLLCRLSQVIGNSSTTIPRQKVCHQKWYAFKENGSYKKVSGRIVQLDEITICSSSDQRKETLEVIPEFPTATDTEASTWDVWTSVELAAEPRRQNSCKPPRCMIRLQRIYNFWLFHAVILSILDVFIYIYNNYIS